jgi:2-polyprenyl-6-hydroxyphenyl methylase / 3-demethylubiquinone-9 3-methyltransferase
MGKDMKKTTVDPKEIDKFSAMADEWWDETGKFKPLHKMNPVRISYIKNQIGNVAGKRMLDVGCGGGLISIPFARLKADVTGIDAGDENIKVAKNYALRNGVEVDYHSTSIEEFSEYNQAKFDIVCALEIVEHVSDIKTFVQHITKCLKPNGLLFISTINKTLKSFALAKVAAEYILRWVPKGTHDWDKFVKPEELQELLKNDFDIIDMSGMVFNPLLNTWTISKKTDVNYIITLRKK